MLKKFAYVTVLLGFAFFVLTASIFKSAAVVYDFNEETMHTKLGEENVLGESDVDIDYTLANPGKILPDSALWPLKAMRDMSWVALTTNDSREAELKLLLADKRLASAEILFDNGDVDLGYSVLTKAEKYLSEACQKESENRKNGIDTSIFLNRLAMASLKHRQMIKHFSNEASEDAKPNLEQLEEIPTKTYEKAMHALNESGLSVPENPFDQ